MVASFAPIEVGEEIAGAAMTSQRYGAGAADSQPGSDSRPPRPATYPGRP